MRKKKKFESEFERIYQMRFELSNSVVERVYEKLHSIFVKSEYPCVYIFKDVCYISSFLLKHVISSHLLTLSIKELNNLKYSDDILDCLGLKLYPVTEVKI